MSAAPSRPIAVETPSPDQIRERVLADVSLARFYSWGVRPYGEVLALQERLRDARRADSIPDTWLAGEHPTVITQGVRGEEGDLTVANPPYPVFQIDRGGMTTLHNPGQLVIYTIVKTREGIVAQGRLARTLLATVRDWLTAVSGVALDIHKGRPGLYFGERKVAAIGLSIHSRVSMHGIAINLINDLSPWRAIVPCGEPTTRPMTLSEAAGRPFAPADLLAAMPDWLETAWGYEKIEGVREL